MVPGERFDRFEIIETLGKGGMGVVVAARDARLRRRVALKLVRPDNRDAPRLLTEARAMARLRHRNVVSVYEAGERDGRLFIAMEEMRGGSLREHLGRRPDKSWREIVEMYMQAGHGLAAAHAAGMVHRDFKPDNVLVSSDGRVCVGDFGLVGARSSSGEFSSAALGGPMSIADEVLGTPAYMAPEQHYGRAADARADQFAFCVSMWEALYGRLPFDGTTRRAYVDNMCEGRLRSDSGRRVPGWVRRVLARGLSVDPDDRYDSMEALLEQFADADFRRSMRVRPLAGFFAVAAVAPLLGLLFEPRYEAILAVEASLLALLGGFVRLARDPWRRNPLNRRLSAGLAFLMVSILITTGGIWLAGLPPIFARVVILLVIAVFFAVVALTIEPRTTAAAIGFSTAFFVAAASPEVASLCLSLSIAFGYLSVVGRGGPEPAARKIRESAERRERSLPHSSPSRMTVPGSRIGRFVVDSILHRCRTGIVLGAHDPRLDRSVTLWLDAVHADGMDAVAELRHPNILTVYEVGVHQGRHYRVTEPTQAVSLAAWIEDNETLRWEQAARIFAQIARGLGAAHREGISHGRFSTEHVYLEDSGRVVVGGFQTGSGGALADQQADMLAFCGVMWELITTKTTAPSWFYSIVARGLDPDPSRRYQSMAELLRVLDPAEDEYGAAASLWRAVLIVILPVCAISVGVLGWLGNYSNSDYLVAELAVLLLLLGLGAGYRERISQTQLNRVVYRTLILSVVAAVAVCVGSMLADLAPRHTEALSMAMFAVIMGAIATLYDRGVHPGAVVFAAGFVASAAWPEAFPAMLAAASLLLAALSLRLLARPGAATAV